MDWGIFPGIHDLNLQISYVKFPVKLSKTSTLHTLMSNLFLVSLKLFIYEHLTGILKDTLIFQYYIIRRIFSSVLLLNVLIFRYLMSYFGFNYLHKSVLYKLMSNLIFVPFKLHNF